MVVLLRELGLIVLLTLLVQDVALSTDKEVGISRACRSAQKLGFCKDGVCIKTLFAFICNCPAGFLLSQDGNQCIDIDECKANPCDQREECYNSKGSFSCECKGGYERTLHGKCQVSDFIFLEAEQILSRQSDEGFTSGDDEESMENDDADVVVAIYGSGEEESSGNDNQLTTIPLPTTTSSKIKVVSRNFIQPTDEDFETEISTAPPINPECQRLKCTVGSKCVQDDEVKVHCQCPWPRVGKHCEKEVTIVIPRFQGHSYMRLPKMSHASEAKFRLVLEINPASLNGLILYSGETLKGDRDFFSLGLKDGTLQFRFDCGTGVGKLESESKIPVNDWTLVTVYRFHQSASLNVNNTYSITGKSQGKYPYITFTEDVYLGGLPDYQDLSPSVGFSAGFKGFVRTLLVNQRMYALHSQSQQVIAAFDVGA